MFGYFVLRHLSSSLRAHGKAEEGGGFGVALHFEVSKGGGVPLDGLGDLPVY